MNRQFKCFIFDLDGTLINSVADIAAAFNHMRSGFGYPQLSTDVIQQMIGNGVRDLMKKSFANVNVNPTDDELNQAIKLHSDYYNEHQVVYTTAYPGVKETLEFLQQHSIRTAVVTNKRGETAQKILQILQLAEHLDCIIGDRAGLKLKPAPDGLLAAAQELGVEPAECVMVGDNYTDLGAARAGGMRSVFCRYGLGCKGDETADYDIEQFAELKDFIQ